MADAKKKQPKRRVNVGANDGKMGRPRKEIDFDQLEKLLEIQCTLNEVAGWFECSDTTIETRIREHYGKTFLELAAEKKGRGKIAIRRKQMQKAIGGDTTMLIWLGKQHLDQADKADVRNTIKLEDMRQIISAMAEDVKRYVTDPKTLKAIHDAWAGRV